MNSYFVAHPEMVLGDTVEESTAYGMDITVHPIEGMELSELLKEAISHIQGTYQAVELPEADKGKEIETIPATPDVKNFSYTVVDGDVYFRENSLMRRVDLNEKAKDRVMGMVELRGIVNELIEYQLEDYPDEMITQKQAELNDAYDAFAAKNGLINNRANGQAFADDSSYYLLCSLENVDEDGNLKSKGHFDVVDVLGKRRVTKESFERWYASQTDYRTVEDQELDADIMASTYGLPEMARMLGVHRQTIYYIVANEDFELINDEYVGRAEEYKAAKSALLEGLGLEHLFDHSHELTPKEKEIWMLFDRVDIAELLARDAFAKGAYMLGAEDREIMLK